MSTRFTLFQFTFFICCLFYSCQFSPSKKSDQRVEDLLSQMSLEEKIGQMTQLNISMINTTGQNQDIILDEEKTRKLLQEYKIGSFLNGNAAPAEDWYRFSKRLREIAIEESRLDIPIIYGIDHVHGADFLEGATIFPQPINLAATFNPAFAAQMGRVTVRESADLGHHWIFAPVLDLGINHYWPRLWETFGEDPLVASDMGKAFVEALQDSSNSAPYKVAACAKHFIGYSDPRSGWDRTPVHVPDQYLHEFFRPSFQTSFDAGIKTVMINSGEINGVPAHASSKILRNLLRDEMGFEGVAVTDWGDIQKLVRTHRVAANEKEATFKAIQAGIDMSMTATSINFCKYLKELVEEGRITESRIDESVRRILTLKFELGLFDNLTPRNDRFDRIGSDEHRKMALETARESIVLLKNDLVGKKPVLPLSTNTRVLLTGMSANSKKNLAGGWTIEWQGAAEERYPKDMLTVKTALEQQFGNVGHAVSASDIKKMASASDVIVVATGEQPYTEFEGNINDLSLAKEEMELIRTAVETGLPVVLVLIEGRPRIFTDVEERLAGVIWAGLPGFEGAEAIADILSGNVNPSGKLSISYPAYVGHNNAYHHKNTDKDTYLYPFGYGLSYSGFTYENLTLSDTIFSDQITAEIQLSNTGDIAGKESILWFLTDEVGTITRPVKMLKHFEKVQLEGGDQVTATFNIKKEHLTYPDENGDPIFEPGYYTLQVGGKKVRFYAE